MGYLGLTPTTAQQTYLNVDDISGSFNGSTTSFALLVGGVAPSPFPVTNSCLISVGGVVQRPDDSGTEGFRISGGNIIFSSAPGTGEDFFGVVLAGADYLNVGANFPDGTVGVPSITFQADTDTGIYRGGSGIVSVASNGVAAGSFSSTGFSAVAGTVGAPAISTITDTNTGIYFPAADNIGFVEGGVEALRIDSSGRVGIGTSANIGAPLHITENSSTSTAIRLSNNANAAGTYSQIYFSYSPTDTSYGAAIRFSYPSTSDPGGTISFLSGSSLSERARIDSSGRLLVGTTSASTTQNATVILQGNSGGATGYGQLVLAIGTATPTNGENLGEIRFSDSGQDRVVKIEAQRDGGTWSGTSKPSRLVFSTTADGASSPTVALSLFKTRSAEFNTSGAVYNATDNACNLGGSGNRWATVYAATGTINTSDQREKTDIADAALGADFIKSLHPVSYKWIEGRKVETGEYDEKNNPIYKSVPGQRTHWGFIAQEVKQAVDAAGVDFGGWVLADKDDPDSQQALRYDQFIAPLTKALQEALAEIDVLKAKVAALEA